MNFFPWSQSHRCPAARAVCRTARAGTAGFLQLLAAASGWASLGRASLGRTSLGWAGPAGSRADPARQLPTPAGTAEGALPNAAPTGRAQPLARARDTGKPGLEHSAALPRRPVPPLPPSPLVW